MDLSIPILPISMGLGWAPTVASHDISYGIDLHWSICGAYWGHDSHWRGEGLKDETCLLAKF